MLYISLIFRSGDTVITYAKETQMCLDMILIQCDNGLFRSRRQAIARTNVYK